MKVKTGYVDCNDITIFYREIGHGPPLLLLHGGLLNGAVNWQRHYPWLSQHFRVISPDHRGHGRTTNPSQRFDSYGLLADDIAVFLEQLDLPEAPIVMGLSSGALIGLYLAVQHPQHVQKLIIVSVHLNIGTSEKFQQGIRDTYATDDYTQPPSYWRHIFYKPIESLLYSFYHKQLHWYDLLTSVWSMWITSIDNKEQFSEIDCPTFILYGTADDFGLTSDFLDLHQRISGSQLQCLPNADHIFVINQPIRLLRDAISPFLFPGTDPQSS